MPGIYLPEHPYGHPKNSDYAYDKWVQEQLDNQMKPAEISFNEERHEYRIDGYLVPSVTAIIKPLITVGGMPDVREYKRQIGKALDTAITLWERQDLDIDTVDPAVLPFFEAWIKFKQETGFRVLLNQPIVYSKKLRFAGTADLIGTRRTDSEVPEELIDTKCVWTMDPATAIQTAGYTIGALESLGLKIKKRTGLQLLRDGTYRAFPYTEQNDENIFRSLLNIYSWKGMHK
jgi:hypothetical protein